MSQTFQLGMNAKIYQGDEGTDLELLTEMSNVRDVTLTMEAGEADVTTRGNSGWRATAATLREATCEFEMLWEPGDAGFEAVRTAFLASSLLALCPLTDDRDTADAEGPRGDWAITGFNRAEPLEEGITVSVTAKLAVFEEWVQVAA